MAEFDATPPAIANLFILYSLHELCAGNGETIDEHSAAELLGAGNRGSVFDLVRSVSAKDYSAIYAKISELVMESKDLTVFWQELIDTYPG